jgi:drug/metabolite transporter (DMT)-like permease
MLTKPKFTVLGMLRLLLHLYPLRFNFAVLGGGLVFVSYGIYLNEREVDYETWTYLGAMFCGLVSMMCLYPADPYEIYTPVTWPGKLLAISSSGCVSFFFG